MAAPTDRPNTHAERAYMSLTDDEADTLLRSVFEILEYDSDGNPGAEWSSDTTQALGDLFNGYDILFTDPNMIEPGVI